METTPYSLCLSYSHRNRPVLILSEVEAFPLLVDVVFEIAFAPA